MQLSLWALIKDQWTTVPPVAKADLKDKTVIVTGANVGLGFEAAKHFARMNPGKLILACRNKEKGEAAVNAIKQETGCDTVEVWSLDLQSFASVKSFAEKFEEEGNRLDILVENAGTLPTNKLKFTADGWETSVQTNDLSTSLLALLLLPRLLDTAEKFNTAPRLVVLTSETHYWSKPDKRILDSPNPFNQYAHKDHLISRKGGFDRYTVTKLLNILFVRALDERLHRKPLIVNAVFRRDLKGIRRFFDRLMELSLARTTEEGSRVPVWAAVGAEEKKDQLRGAYISLMKVEEPSDFVVSAEGKAAQEKFWNNLIEELNQVEPKVSQIVSQYLS
ncbi:hypothetical protein CVT26_001853 [Gymnopilus dilepis]|uniref:NAD(P)-binding protein n=1 Tax=Gymnopilus dilepis TaxID=231916 RepID=A0A409WAY3_9AGAR|nr:hypothetical protein CVT26_001853 [Gymnopilus dilepis]